MVVNRRPGAEPVPLASKFIDALIQVELVEVGW
jgi:hypothetical protein